MEGPPHVGDRGGRQAPAPGGSSRLGDLRWVGSQETQGTT